MKKNIIALIFLLVFPGLGLADGWPWIPQPDGTIAPARDKGIKVRSASIGGTRVNDFRELRPRAAMTTISIGNSIAAMSMYGYGSASSWRTYAEVQLANALSGGSMIFKQMTATTRADKWGAYGYSGQVLSTIRADLEGQLFGPLRTAGITPDLIIGLALQENDIAADLSVSVMQKSLNAFVREMNARYPGVILLLCTPRPSLSYNTPDRVLAYQTMRDYVLSLDNGINIFTARLDTYENPASPGTPLAGFTDASVHPTVAGAWRNARVIADTLNRIGSLWTLPYHTLSTNYALTGSGAASGTNVTGTVPASCAVSGHANGVFVAEAENPGFLITITPTVGQTEMSTSNMGSLALSGVTQISPFAEIEIVSGADQIRWVSLEPRIADGGGNNFQLYLNSLSGDGSPEFVDGDKLFLRQPPVIAASGSITALQNYFRVIPKADHDGSPITIRIIQAGVAIVE